MRGHRNAAGGAGKPERTLGDAAEGLRLANGHVELAVTHRGSDRRSPQLGIRDLDGGGRESKVEIEVGHAVKRDG